MSLLSTLVLALVVGFCLTTVAMVCSTVYLHRALAHRALTLAAPARGAFRLVTWISTGIRPRQWVAVHRKHHAFTDVPGDPHSPALLGWWTVQRSNVTLYRREARNPVTVQRYARDIPADTWDRALFDKALVGLAIGVGLLVVVFGPVVGLLAAFVHVNLYLGGSAAVNALGHQFGRRPYDNRAGNLQLLAFITAGEGLHNNHHAAPTSARLSHRWYEIDPGWWVITALSALRLARVRLAAPRVIARRARAGMGGLGAGSAASTIGRHEPAVADAAMMG